jgi:hypothetical protein
MAKRRVPIEHKTDLSGAISDAWGEFVNLRDEIGDWQSSLESANMEQVPKYEEVTECKDALDNFADEEPDVPELPVGFPELLTWQTPNKRRQSRSDRMSDACAALGAAVDAIDTFLQDHQDDDVDVSDLETLKERLEEVQSEAEGISFPGMY